MRITLIMVLIILTSFNLICLIEISFHREVTHKAILSKKSFMNNFTKCKLHFGLGDDTLTVEQGIDVYYNTPLYKEYQIRQTYGMISGRLKKSTVTRK